MTPTARLEGREDCPPHTCMHACRDARWSAGAAGKQPGAVPGARCMQEGGIGGAMHRPASSTAHGLPQGVQGRTQTTGTNGRTDRHASAARPPPAARPLESKTMASEQKGAERAEMAPTRAGLDAAITQNQTLWRTCHHTKAAPAKLSVIPTIGAYSHQTRCAAVRRPRTTAPARLDAQNHAGSAMVPS